MARTRSAARFPDRTDPSMVAGNPVSVQSPARNRFFQRRRPRPAAAHFAPAWPQMWRGARARSARAAVRPATPAALQISRQIACASSSRGMSTSRSALLMVTDSRCGNANNHSTSPPTTPMDRRHVVRRIEAEMRVHDRPEFGRRLQARQQRRRRPRRDRQHHGIIGPERDRVVAKLQFADAARRHAEAAQFMSELDAGALALQQLDRGFDQNRAQALARDQRPASLSSRQQRFPHNGAGKPRRPLGRIDVERRQQQRLHQPLVKRAPRTGWRRQPVCPVPPRSEASTPDSRASRYRGRGAPASKTHSGSRLSPRSSCQRWPVVKIDKGKLGALRPDQPGLGADRPCVSHRMTVAGEQEMIAVIDGQVGRGVEIGAAAAARLLRGLVDSAP